MDKPAPRETEHCKIEETDLVVDKNIDVRDTELKSEGDLLTESRYPLRNDLDPIDCSDKQSIISYISGHDIEKSEALSIKSEASKSNDISTDSSESNGEKLATQLEEVRLGIYKLLSESDSQGLDNDEATEESIDTKEQLIIESLRK